MLGAAYAATAQRHRKAAMPSKEHVESLIAMVRAGQTIEAMRRFYADDATMQENQQQPRSGLSALLAHEQKLLDGISSMTTQPVDSYFINGDEVVIHWVFDIVDRKGREFVMDELAHQVWKGDKIIRERFYYDPAPQPLKAPTA
jgi:ketosteroid isomerase-like protein